MKLTGHAKERMREMGVDADEVYAAVNEPEITWSSSGGPLKQHPDGTSVRVRGRIAVVVNSERRRVITVLWHTTEEYERSG